MKKKCKSSLKWFPVILMGFMFTCLYLIIDRQDRHLSNGEEKGHYDKLQVQNVKSLDIFFAQNDSELRHLRQLVQRRLIFLQNPKNCTAARKVICMPNKAGFGSGLHQVTFCLIVAYATRRTLILNSTNWIYSKNGWETVFLPVSTNCTSTNDSKVTYDIDSSKSRQIIKLPQMQRLRRIPDYMPFAIPDDIADRLERAHMNPHIWWIGQFVDYLIRPAKDLKLYIQTQQEKVLSMRPKVGIHVRRTDKRRETGSYISLEEYMKRVDKWFSLNLNNKTQTKYVYIATDDVKVIREAKEKYPGYAFVYHQEAKTTSAKGRYNLSSLKVFLSEVHILAMCDFVVCTMTSNVCRLVKELKESREWDASERIVSLDVDYFFHYKGMKNFWSAFFEDRTPFEKKGIFLLNNKFGKINNPIFAVDLNRTRVSLPVYPEVKEKT